MPSGGVQVNNHRAAKTYGRATKNIAVDAGRCGGGDRVVELGAGNFLPHYSVPNS